VGKTPIKKVIKSKLKANKELTPQEALREQIKYDIVEELGLAEKVNEFGWSRNGENWRYDDQKEEGSKYSQE